MNLEIRKFHWSKSDQAVNWRRLGAGKIEKKIINEI